MTGGPSLKCGPIEATSTWPERSHMSAITVRDANVRAGMCRQRDLGMDVGADESARNIIQARWDTSRHEIISDT